MPIRAVLLDMDGTLVQPATTATFLLQVCKKLGLSYSAEQIMAARELAGGSWITDLADARPLKETVRELNARFLRALGVKGDLQQFTARMQECWERYPDEVNEQIYPEVHKVLGRLHAMSTRLAVVSLRPEGLIRASLRRHRIEPYFVGVISPQLANAPQGKMSPRMWELALKEVAARPEEVLHVDDDYDAGIRGARQAGIRAVLINRTGVVSGPIGCEVIRDLAGVLPLVEADRSSFS